MRKSIAVTLSIAVAAGSVMAIEGTSTDLSARAESSGHGGGHSGRGDGGGGKSSGRDSGHSDRGNGARARSSDRDADRSDRGNGFGAGLLGRDTDPSDPGNSAGAGSADGDNSAPGNGAGASSGQSKPRDPAPRAGVAGTPVDPTPARPSTTAAKNTGRGGRDIGLPQSLKPAGLTYGYPMQAALNSIPGTPDAVVRVCIQAIEAAARPYGVVRVDAASSGPLRVRRRGAVAPLQVRVQYARQGGVEIRESQVGCRLDAAGEVVGLT